MGLSTIDPGSNTETIVTKLASEPAGAVGPWGSSFSDSGGMAWYRAARRWGHQSGIRTIAGNPRCCVLPMMPSDFSLPTQPRGIAFRSLP